MEENLPNSAGNVELAAEGVRRAARRGLDSGADAMTRHARAAAALASLPETPFVGLVPGEGDAAFFFGRDGEKAPDHREPRAARLVYGASGVGEASLLHAGVVRDLHIFRANAIEQQRRRRGLRRRPDRGLAMRAAASSSAADCPATRRRSSRPFSSSTSGSRALFVVLDQFGLYHEGEDGDGTFAVELPRRYVQPARELFRLAAFDAWAFRSLEHFLAVQALSRIEHFDIDILSASGTAACRRANPHT